VNVATALKAIRNAWWLPLCGLLLGVGAAYGVSSLQTPVYSSTVQLFVSTTGSTSTSEIFQGSQFSQQRVASYAEVVRGRVLADRVVDRLGLRISPAELSRRITVETVPQTVLLDVTATDPSPVGAQRIADALGQEFIDRVSELENSGPGSDSPVEVVVAEPPAVADAPSFPRTGLWVGLGGTAGLLLGLGLSLLRSRLDRSVTDPEELGRLAGAPVIGTLTRDGALAKEPVAAGRTAEDFRRLRTNLQFVNVDAPPTVIMVTSALPSEGKSTLVANLGVALAEAGQRVTVVDADLRRPKVTGYLGLIDGAGLSDVLAGRADVADVAQTYRNGLTVIGAGVTPPNPGELLSSANMATLMAKLRTENDFVLVDAPPLLPVADAAGLAPSVDGVLLAVQHGATRRDQVQQAATALERVGATRLGVVFTLVPPKLSPTAQYGYEAAR
jgi:capsular exopolysaccharide synthesis family protein